ncbi:MAG: U32 family peptidase [Acidiferrobacteraceae bacterium]
MKLAVGPLLYAWSRAEVQEFYREIAVTPVDIVYLGETICPKRRAVSRNDWLEIASGLAESGKQVVLSTLALIEAASDLALVRAVARNGRYPVEANDMAAVRLCGEDPFVAGPHLNVYNARALGVLRRQGAMRWVIPVELGARQIAGILDGRPEGLEVEIFAYGRLPLAFSARCFTARAHHYPKDHCETICNQYPEGLQVSAQDGTPFLVLNGIQTQSSRVVSLIAEREALSALGVDVLRLSPQPRHMPEIITMFRDVLDGRTPGHDRSVELASLSSGSLCNGYFHGGAGMEWRA